MIEKKDTSESMLEKQIADAAREAVSKAISERLSGYQSPLHSIIDRVMSKKAADLEELISSAATTAFSAVEFKAELNAAFTHKLARVLVSKFEGEVEKRAVELRANPVMRAKITIAIENAIKGA